MSQRTLGSERVNRDIIASGAPLSIKSSVLAPVHSYLWYAHVHREYSDPGSGYLGNRDKAAVSGYFIFHPSYT